MANPRQRRKARSGIARNSESKASRKNKKKVIVKGSSVVAEAWDRHKTVRQNYAALGLMATPNPRLSGGLEPLPVVPFVKRLQQQQQEDEPVASTSAQPAVLKDGKIPKGFARVIRDTEGKIIDVIMPEDEEEGDASTSKKGETPWGEPLADDISADSGEEAEIEELDEDQGLNRTQGIPMSVENHDGRLQRVRVRAKEPTAVVKELERIASQPQIKVPRHASDGEAAWLQKMVKKYQGDVQAIARDTKNNVWQRTPGQIKRSIAKAGGLEAVLAA